MAPGDGQHAAAGLENLGIVYNTEQPADPTRPQSHFTVPRELRDRIYGYLLYHDHVHEEPYHTRRQSACGKVSNGWRRRHDAIR